MSSITAETIVDLDIPTKFHTRENSTLNTILPNTSLEGEALILSAGILLSINLGNWAYTTLMALLRSISEIISSSHQ
jgi:hypothetical protein